VARVDAAEVYAPMRERLAAHDLDLLAGLAHELKGVAGMYGFAEVSEKARFLQQLAEKTNDLAEVEARASELIESCRRAAEAGRTNSRRPREQVSDSSPPSSSPSSLETGGPRHGLPPRT
jgi:HPt (histidine-containing phosphotransfer) domain-containing protein